MNDKQPTFDLQENAVEEMKAISDMPEHVMGIINEEKAKLSKLDPGSESTKLKNHLDWLTSIPWGKTSTDNEDIKTMQKVLDEDVFGMKDVKRQILNFFACEQHKNGKILFFWGPFGTGKSAMAKSIARALGRQFCEFSVGMLKKDDTIKGQHREDCGAMPGKLIQCLKEAQTENPVILIDDITEIGSDGLGISAGVEDLVYALFEALNPEQNSNFVDRFIEVPVDLSKVLFILSTSADMNNIFSQGHWEGRLGPLRNRIVTVEFSGYALEEKIKIAKEHLIPKWQGKCNLKEDKLIVSDEAVKMLLNSYCHCQGTGVGFLDDHLEQIYKIAKKDLECGELKEFPLMMSSEKFYDYFGPKICDHRRNFEEIKTLPGMIMILTSSYKYGGGIRYIEADLDTGSTESLKIINVEDNETKISIETAYLVAKKVLKRKDPENDFFDRSHVRIQFPDYVIGASAGTSLVSVFLSLALNLPIRGIAMTGAISLKEKVLPVGGIKDKLDAAKIVGIQRVILPEKNKEQYEELEGFIKEGIDVEFASIYDQVFPLIFPDFKPKRGKKNGFFKCCSIQ